MGTPSRLTRPRVDETATGQGDPRDHGTVQPRLGALLAHSRIIIMLLHKIESVTYEPSDPIEYHTARVNFFLALEDKTCCAIYSRQGQVDQPDPTCTEPVDFTKDVRDRLDEAVHDGPGDRDPEGEEDDDGFRCQQV